MSNLPRPVINPAPGHAQLHTIKVLHLDNFCLRDNLYRETASVPFTNIVYREKDSAVYHTCTATAPAFNQIHTWTAKSTPYLSCHRENYPAKVPGPVAGWLRQVTQPPFIAGPLGLSLKQTFSK
jgi:hypothetical protein